MRMERIQITREKGGIIELRQWDDTIDDCEDAVINITIEQASLVAHHLNKLAKEGDPS